MSLKIRLHESSVTRIMSHLKNYDCGTITAFRGTCANATDNTLDSVKEYEGKSIPLSVKKQWNRDLKAALLKLGYGVTAIKGRYREDGWDTASDEESFFVVNLTDDPDFIKNMARLGEAYNQDSILIKEKGSDNAYLLGTNTSEGDFDPALGETQDIGKLHVNIPLDYLGASSVIGNKAFIFKGDDEGKNEANGNPFSLDTFFAYGNYSKSGIAQRAKPVLEALGLPTSRPIAAYKQALDASLSFNK